MVRVTVDVAAIRNDAPGIIIERGMDRSVAREVLLEGEVRVMQGPPQRDGATAWIEADDYRVLVP